MHKTISIKELQLGHYVNCVVEQEGNVQLKAKGKVTKSEFISALIRKGVTKVEVDLSKSDLTTESSPEEVLDDPEKPKLNSHQDIDSTGLEKANDLFMQAIICQGEFIDQLQKGAVNDLSPIKNMSEQLIENLFDNPNALSCLTFIKNTDQYLLEHSLNCCILMAMFAEYLQFDNEEIEALSLGALLMDIGMARIPTELRMHNGELSESDWHVIKGHVDEGLDIVEQNEDLNAIAKMVIAHHHERIDGKGYPKGLLGEDVSIYGRMAAIVDTYDAMVSHRPHRRALPPAVALKRLASTPGLDSGLVRKFIARIGIHPVGSLVKLKSGNLGIIAKANPKDMLKPVVMTFYNVKGAHYNSVKRIDLSKVDDDIESSVQPSDFNMNLPKFFRDVFINSV